MVGKELIGPIVLHKACMATASSKLLAVSVFICGFCHILSCPGSSIPTLGSDCHFHTNGPPRPRKVNKDRNKTMYFVSCFLTRVQPTFWRLPPTMTTSEKGKSSCLSSSCILPHLHQPPLSLLLHKKLQMANGKGHSVSSVVSS